jgi:hypothetical protein
MLAACGGDTKNNADSSDSSSSSESGGANNSGSGGATSGETSGGPSGTGGTNVGSCPSIEPAVGSACSPERQACSYTNCVSPDFRDDHTLTCVGGAWALSSRAPCTDAGQCPSVVPQIGASCLAASTPGPCSALDACSTLRPATCENGLWTFGAMSLGAGGAGSRIAPIDTGSADVGTATATTGILPDPPSCPENPPLVGQPCCPSSVPEYCYYGPSVAAGGSAGFGAPVPAAGGASSAAQAASTTQSTTSGDAGSAGAGADIAFLECVECSEDMRWVASSRCP